MRNILFALVFLASCGNPHLEQRTEKDVDYYSQVEKTFADFEMETGEGLDGFSYAFVDAKFHSYADCRHKIVVISHDWKKLDPELKEWSIFHTLGHCKLGKFTHYLKTKENKEPESIMNLVPPSVEFYKKNRKEYIEELKGHKTAAAI